MKKERSMNVTVIRMLGKGNIAITPGYASLGKSEFFMEHVEIHSLYHIACIEHKKFLSSI